MNIRSFSIGETLKTAWTKFKEKPFTWIGALILMVLILGSHPFVDNWAMGHGFKWDINMDLSNLTEPKYPESSGSVLIGLLYYFVHLGLNLGFISMGLRAVDGLPFNIFHIFSRFKYVFHYFISYILYMLIIVAGLILFLFPAAIWASKFSLYPYFIIDQNAGPIEALKKSSSTTYGFKWDLFAFLFVSACLTLIGVTLLVIGLLVVLPILSIAWATIYRRLTNVFEPAVIQPNKY